ncbi:hypothetical protein LAZ67_X000522, partial [Cordylochernes scorpioides]
MDIDEQSPATGVSQQMNAAHPPQDDEENSDNDGPWTTVTNVKKPRIPPVIAENVADWKLLCQELKDLCMEPFQVTISGKKHIIKSKNIGDFKKIREYVQKNNGGYSYRLQEEKPLKVVLKGVSTAFKEEDVVIELVSMGFTEVIVKRLHRQSTKIPMNIVLVELPKNEPNKRIYGITEILYQKIVVESFRTTKRVTQCFNCQGFGHCQLNCFLKPKCVKCAEEHHSKDCPRKSKQLPPKCANCGEAHTANYRGCPNFPKPQQQQLKPPRQNSPNTIPQASSTKTEEAIVEKQKASYAETAKKKTTHSDTRELCENFTKQKISVLKIKTWHLAQSKRIRKRKKMAENPNNRLQKFNGSKSAIRPESWIKLYDFENNSLKEDEKIKNLMYYLTDSALEWYADEIISNPAIKRWEVVKEKLIQRFGSYNANPIVSASHRRLKREESIENYFQDKIRLLNQTHLTKEEKIHLLTDGLPNDWKDLIVAAQPTDATKWFHIAASIEQNRASIQFKPKNKIHLATKNNDSRKNVCPFWCPICSKKGIKIKHWVTDCEDYDPNYKKDRPNQNTSVKQVCGAPELLNVSTLTNTPTQGAFKLINISVEVNGIPAQAFVDTGATVSIINWRLFKRTRLQLQPNSDIHISQADGVTRTCGSLQTKHAIDLGKVAIQHKIITKSEQPISLRPYRRPLKEYEEIAEQVKELLEHNHNQLKPDPGKVKSIQDFPRPDTVKKVRQFMGLENYYRKFVKDFSKISFPLVRLTRKNQPFIWNEEVEESFAKLKMALSTKPVRAIYNPDYPSKVYTDASKYGIGAILTQIGPDNEEHVIAYYSKTLQPHQENYSAYEMECLAVIQATDHFHVYIENQPFEIITDHAALQWLFTMKKPKPKYFRWILSLSSKSCSIVHRSGKQQTHVDALSRLPVVNIATQELQEHQHNSDLSFLKNSHTHDGVVRHEPTLGEMITPTSNIQPLQMIGCDTIVLVTAAANTKHKFIQVFVDHATRYLWAYPTITNTAQAVTQCFDKIIKSVNSINTILTDNGKNFISKEFNKFLSLQGIKHTYTSPYHPQCNGICEKLNDTIMTKLRIAVLEKPRCKWRTLLPQVVKNYNSTPHDVTGFSPLFLMYGIGNVPEFADQTPITIEEARKKASLRTEQIRSKWKIKHDSHHPKYVFKEGDLVIRKIAFNDPRLIKTSPKYEGPFVIQKKISDVTYDISLKDQKQARRLSYLRLPSSRSCCVTMAAVSAITAAVEKLNGQNYRSWKYNIKMLLIEKGLWDVMFKNEDTQDAKLKAQKDRALAVIALSINTEHQIHIIDCSSPQDAWKNLEQVFEPKSRSRILQLKKQFVNIKLQTGESMLDYLNRLKICTDHLKEAGAEVDDQDIAYSMLSGLPDSFDTLVMSFGNVEDSDFTSNKVRNTLLTEYERRSAREGASSGLGEALNFSKDDTRKTSRKQGVKCYRCSKIGHIAKDCRSSINRDYKADKSYSRKKDSFKSPSENMLMAFNTVSSEDEFILDSGATHHVCKNRQWFTSFQPTTCEPIQTASGNLQVEGVGNIRMKMYLDTGTQDVTLNDVLFVPQARRNLLSVSQTEDKGKHIKICNHKARVFSDNRVICVARNLNGLYIVRGKPILQNAHLASSSPPTLELWHKRFMHINADTLNKLAKNCVVNGLEISKGEMSICDDCCMTKSTMAPHKSSPYKIKTKNLLELVHSDLCGPFPVESFAGSRYFLTFTDDFSRRVAVYFLKHKYQVIEYFDIFRARAERETGHKIKRLRTDNGLEYCNKNFKQKLESLGIKHELTNSYSPQQNGVSERLNRSLLDMARASMHNADLPQKFWAESVNCAAYIKNRSLCSALDNKVPEEIWISRKVSVRHFKIFGALAYAHIPKQKRKKFDRRAKRCILVGYSTQSKGYRLWDNDSKQVFITKHARFDENKVGLNQLKDDVTKGSEAKNSFVWLPQQGKVLPPRDPDLQQGYDSQLEVPSTSEVSEPQTFEEAVCSPESDLWKNAMQEELNCLEERQTWVITNLPKNKKVIGNRCVFKIKGDSKGKVSKFKARLVAKGYSQTPDIDFNQTYAPVANFGIIRMLLVFTQNAGWVNRHLDINNAYLYGELHEELYMALPPGVKFQDSKDKVLRLLKPIYGLKQAAFCWNTTLSQFLEKVGFSKIPSCNCIFVLDDRAIIAIYVDDLAIFAVDQNTLDEIEDKIIQEFQIKSLGPITFFLGIEINYGKESLSLNQRHYIQTLLQRYNMFEVRKVCTPLDPAIILSKIDCPHTQAEIDHMSNIPYKELIGTLLYLSNCTRPDISFATSKLSQFCANPGKKHWEAAKHVLRYLSGTIDLELSYVKGNNNKVAMFTDADYGSDTDDRRSYSGMVAVIDGNVINWRSKKQQCVSLSTMESEYIALCHSAKEAVWLGQTLSDLGFMSHFAKPLTIYCDNRSAIDFSKNNIENNRSKHISVQFHYTRDKINSGDIVVQFVNTKENMADIQTKTLKKLMHRDACFQMNLKSQVLNNNFEEDYESVNGEDTKLVERNQKDELKKEDEEGRSEAAIPRGYSGTDGTISVEKNPNNLERKEDEEQACEDEELRREDEEEGQNETVIPRRSSRIAAWRR